MFKCLGLNTYLLSCSLYNIVHVQFKYDSFFFFFGLLIENLVNYDSAILVMQEVLTIFFLLLLLTPLHTYIGNAYYVLLNFVHQFTLFTYVAGLWLFISQLPVINFTDLPKVKTILKRLLTWLQLDIGWPGKLVKTNMPLHSSTSIHKY